MGVLGFVVTTSTYTMFVEGFTGVISAYSIYKGVKIASNSRNMRRTTKRKSS